MSFPVFPILPSMEWNSKKTQRWNTKVQKTGSGKRKAMTTWSYPEWLIQCSYKALSEKEIERVAGFCAVVRGGLQPFLWLDPEDYQQTNVYLGSGDGEKTEFQLLRNFDDIYVEPIRDVVLGSLQVFCNGKAVMHELLQNGGINMAAPPAKGARVTASFQYYWRVAFEDDALEWNNFWYGYYKLNQIKLVTVR